MTEQRFAADLRDGQVISNASDEETVGDQTKTGVRAKRVIS
jgi:hypothetical protein